PQIFHHLAVEEKTAVRGHRADRQLRLVRRAKLAGNDDVQLGVKGTRDLGGGRNAAAGDAQGQSVLDLVRILRCGEPAAGLDTIGVGLCPAAPLCEGLVGCHFVSSSSGSLRDTQNRSLSLVDVPAGDTSNTAAGWIHTANSTSRQVDSDVTPLASDGWGPR